MPDQAQQVIRDYEHAVSRIVLYCVSESQMLLGKSKTIGILKGAKSTFFIEHDLHQLATYGILPSFTGEYLRTVIDYLLERGLLEIKMVSEYDNLPTLILTPKGQQFLVGETDIDIPFVEKLCDKEVVQLTEDEQELFDILRQLRFKIAVAKNLPAYTICHDAILREMAKAKPTTCESLLAMRGIGEKFVQNYGDLFLETIRPYAF
jgi:ATP-dependent DNA helicase RecQ